MSSNVLDGRSVVLRLEFSIADAVRQRGLRAVVGAALRAWWAQRPSRYADVPPYLRDDLGLPPEEEAYCLGVGIDPWRLHPPRGRWP